MIFAQLFPDQLKLAQFGVDLNGLAEQAPAWALSGLANVVAAVLLLIVGWWLSGRLSRALERYLIGKENVDQTLVRVLSKIVRYIVAIVVLIAALGQLGLETTSILAVLGAAGIAIGLALQGTLSNIAAGVMLLWLRPFNIGETLDADGYAGTVQDIGLFATTLRTVDGLFLFVPNSELWNKRLINFSRNPKRMVRQTFTISYDDDIGAARKVLQGVIGADERVHVDPAPTVKVTELADSAVVLEVRAWTDTPDHFDVLWGLNENGKTALEDAGLSIPYPQQDIHVRSGSFADTPNTNAA